MVAYLQVFCRCVIILAFIISCLSKVRHIKEFQQVIINFALLPQGFSRSVAILFLLAEALVVVLLALAGPLLFPGYVLASILLLLFSIALLSVLVRHISTSCACFGPSTTPISAIDLVRNSGLLLCSFAGCLTVNGTVHGEAIDLPVWTLSGLCALIFVGVWTQLSEIVQLFH